MKGGNAIGLAYGLGDRSSLDVDFSISGDFADLDDIQRRISRALTDRFDSAGYLVFDQQMRPKPSSSREAGWGGYEYTFKLIEKTRAASIREDDLPALRRNASVIGRAAGDSTKFKIEISKHEFCSHWQEIDLDYYSIRVYTPTLLALEKLRAICQQMDAYPHRRHRAPRARDFYDIHTLISRSGVNFGSQECFDLVPQIFAAKQVPLHLLAELPSTREFHRLDWPSVMNATSHQIEPFDYYFDFVMRESRQLKPLWDV